ncbi:MAG: cytochrome c oxidase subunit 4 [Chloroflexi bacterium]|nr:cytochrome c oxidase subunit 4 [Chloroflexota bacterium]
MAEEFRLFFRTALYVGGAGLVYWLVSLDAPGTVLLVALTLALLAFVGMAIFLAPRGAGAEGRSGVLGLLNRYIGFHEPVDAAPPLESGPELVPLGSAWPIITALGMVVIGLGLIFGAWLSLPGIGLVVWGAVGWLTQLDRMG